MYFLHAVYLPIPNNSDSVLYSTFVDNFQIVIATLYSLYSTLIENLRLVWYCFFEWA